MTHTHHPGIVATWKLKINNKHYVEVFIWQDKESMYAADDYNKERIKHIPDNLLMDKRDFGGKAFMFTQVTRIKDDKMLIPKKFGEIFLVAGCYGAGVAAHEIAHIVNYWGGAFGWIRDGKHDEASAQLSGKLTSQFWKEHYKHFKQMA